MTARKVTAWLRGDHPEGPTCGACGGATVYIDGALCEACERVTWAAERPDLAPAAGRMLVAGPRFTVPPELLGFDPADAPPVRGARAYRVVSITDAEGRELLPSLRDCCDESGGEA